MLGRLKKIQVCASEISAKLFHLPTVTSKYSTFCEGKNSNVFESGHFPKTFGDVTLPFRVLASFSISCIRASLATVLGGKAVVHLQLLRFSVLSGRITKAFASFFFPAEAL
jgi:hypothetical protein